MITRLNMQMRTVSRSNGKSDTANNKKTIMTAFDMSGDIKRSQAIYCIDNLHHHHPHACKLLLAWNQVLSRPIPWQAFLRLSANTDNTFCTELNAFGFIRLFGTIASSSSSRRFESKTSTAKTIKGTENSVWRTLWIVKLVMWKLGKDNLRAFLGSIDTVMWEGLDSGWLPYCHTLNYGGNEKNFSTTCAKKSND